MLKLIFVTHPQIVIDENTPIDKWKLSETGINRAKGLVNLPFIKDVTAIYSSKEPKAYSVADMIADKLQDENKQVECLGEIKNRTFIPPDKFEVATSNWFKNPDVNVNGWESRNETQNRIVTCVTKIMMNKRGNVLIVGHGGAGTLLKCFIKGIFPTQAEDQNNTGNYFIADWENKKILQDWNYY